MHHSLEIAEIQLLIFSYIAKSPERPSSTLRHLALTCRAFRDPALALLWKNMISLAPLFACLPGKCWEERLSNNGKTLVSLKGTLLSVLQAAYFFYST